jgi:hypothetical protein
MSEKGEGRGDVAVNEFEFQVCGRCGHPPSDGPCIMGNDEHADTWPKPFAAFAVVRDLSSRATQAERERDELRKALRRIIADDTYATKIARTALHPQDSTERTDDA